MISEKSGPIMDIIHWILIIVALLTNTFSFNARRVRVRNKYMTRFLDASSHLCNRICPSVGPSVGWLVTLSSKTRKINIFEQIVDRGSILGLLNASWVCQEDYHRITSSYNLFIMRTHRWPHGPCSHFRRIVPKQLDVTEVMAMRVLCHVMSHF